MMRRVIVLAVLALIILPVSAASYFTASSLPPLDESERSIITNSYVLRDSLPPTVYAYALSRLERYQAKDAPGVDSFTIKDEKLERINGRYGVLLQPSDGSKAVLMLIGVENYGDFFSISVIIDGKLQAIS